LSLYRKITVSLGSGHANSNWGFADSN